MCWKGQCRKIVFYTINVLLMAGLHMAVLHMAVLLTEVLLTEVLLTDVFLNIIAQIY